MNPQAWFDGIALLAYAAATLVVAFGWRRALGRDTKLLLAGLLVLKLVHAVSNVLESRGILAGFDLYEDYIQLLEPVLWFSIAYAFLQDRSRRVLRDSEQQLLDLYENAPAAYLSVEIDGRIRRCNQRAAQLLGWDAAGLVGRSVFDMYADAPAGRPAAETVLEQFRSGQEIVDEEIQMQRADGTPVWVSLTLNAIRDERGQVVGSRLMIVDISARKRAEEVESRLRRIQERSQQYLDVARDMFVVLNRDGQIELANQRALEILGYASAEELLGRSWFDVCVPADRRETVRAVFGQMMSGELEAVERYENPVLTRIGGERTIAWKNTVLRDEEGRILGTLSSGEDITERRRAEHQREALEVHLRQTQKLESIGTLASGIAYELNNPLMGVINYAQLIQDCVDEKALKKYAAGIIEEGNRMANIVRQVLSFARQDMERHSPADLRDIVDATLSLAGAVFRRDQIQIHVDAAPKLPKVRCRSQQIQQVLMNLLTNARDALNRRYAGFDENKSVSITVKPTKDGKWVRMTAEDHGTGIPEDQIDRVFDPFFTTKPRDQGTGLGLSIGYGIVGDHGGRLAVESELGIYTRFIMDLPVLTREGK